MSGGVPPRALTVAGSDSGGGAGLQCDLRTFLCCGVHGATAVTAVTVQDSRGVTGVHEVPADVVAAQVEAVVGDIGVGATKTGMLASAPIIEAVADVVERLDVGPFVVDPVCASMHGSRLLRPDALDALRTRLLPLATLVTPNAPEARLLTGLPVTDRAGQVEAARALHALGPRWVLVKGGHVAEGEPAVDVLFDGERVLELRAPRVATPHTHGTGDCLAAATTAWLAQGLDVVEAVRRGKQYVTAAVVDAYPAGAGAGPVGHRWRVRDWPAEEPPAAVPSTAG
ncbi:bifunctional hydroxymethylpyrimidine kinase/phosphomethylpyrimidine kinase [Vallicoccus soli]|uniref:bifunctional hydroxymethylpyrimidine kinase/phosphomethylpyrimidine kinase n=1 Tax=Vallicoccus soli TaxID=2339232 RepID=UPI001FE379E3|nr:bifunctional hydroxymethylpyrimidine kinase/phosphomethylpyrimidine kinase [Vallicoccus soli]